MSSSTSHKPSPSSETDAGGGGGSRGHDEEGGGGGGGGGKLVKVAFAHQQAEAEMIQGLLSAHGIPSMLRRAAGFDVPDFLAAGPREILVAEEVAPDAREVLEGTGAS
jgi:Putative prokaryotic signal transducing protein